MPLTAEWIFKAGIALALLGFGILTAGFIMAARGAKGKVKGGGFVLVGPIPVILGFGRGWSTIVIALLLIFLVLILMVFLLPISF